MTFFQDITPNYYGNVQNAFASADALKTAMEEFTGPKWFLAHSLGNMLVSAAIQDCGMPYEKYFMLNAAVAMEAFDASSGITQESHDNMTPEAWANYPDRLRATHWGERFPSGDGRRLLTWKGRFANVTDIVNFYSSQEEVLANGDGMPKSVGREHSWYNQEYCKGNWTWMLHYNEGGAFNHSYGTTTYSYVGNAVVENWEPLTPSVANNLSDSELQQTPFFLDFVNPEMHASSNGAVVATNYLYRAEMLAYAIPAESYAVGANSLPWLADSGFNINMAAFIYGQQDLPANGTVAKDRHRDWQHSTFVQRSYKRTQQLFKRIIRVMKGEEE